MLVSLVLDCRKWSFRQGAGYGVMAARMLWEHVVPVQIWVPRILRLQNKIYVIF